MSQRSGSINFTVYRVLAFLASGWLLLLTFVAMPAKYLVGADAAFPLVHPPAAAAGWFGDDSLLMTLIAVPHGYIYLAYVLAVLWLAVDRRWGVWGTVSTMLAGTIPFLGFVVEHRLAVRERERLRGTEGGAVANGDEAGDGGQAAMVSGSGGA
ncbi:DUF3817 domain-containing protein [Lipingzhangella sp. LS1_29]|uniref:DUF3817 domain-containing protein n=1 Tax=Lipingzhangella rawalii TaxID=2055835 RepID=A0ABU2H420_9ACTN|nr:DUF3817 domain-containing protein [Lipingzhangella rawalii]MDS1270059.1 DUF3817 domain-containing protein [Lipingzhangella rawalii]